MSQLPTYTPAHEFLTDEAATPAFPGSEIDIELAALQTILAQYKTNIALIQRDDGALKNGIVTTDSLDTVLAAAFGDTASTAEVQALVDACDTDVVLTHADVVLTHADVVLTHADVVLTHADVVAAAASAVAAAASAATLVIDVDGTLAANSDIKVASQKATKTYADGLIIALKNGVAGAFDTLAEIAAELALKATIASPTFTGTPAAPTAAAATNTTQIATTAFVKTEIPLVARGQGKETIWIPASAMWPRTTNGPGAASRELTTAGDVMIRGLAFDTTTEEAAQFYIGFPKSWNKSTITFQAYWTNVNGLTTETVSWGLSAGAFTDDDAIDSTELGTEVRVADTWLAANDLHVTAESGAVTIGNTPIDGDLVIGQIARSVANDNMTGDAELLGIKIFFTTSAATDA